MTPQHPPFTLAVALDPSTMDTDGLLSYRRALERRCADEDNSIAKQALILRHAEVERWIAIHNVRAQRRLDAGEPRDPAQISAAVVVRMIEVLGDIVLEMQRRAVYERSGKALGNAALTDEQINKLATHAFLAGGEELRRVAQASAPSPSPPVPQGELALDGDAL